MLYSVLPFSLKQSKDTTFLYCTKGIFMVDSVDMASLLSVLKETDFIESDKIVSLWNKNPHQDVNTDDVLDYLCNEVQVLIALQTEFRFRTPFFVASGATPGNVILSLFERNRIISRDEINCESNTREPTLFIIDMTDNVRTKEIEKIQDIAGKSNTVIFIFLIGDHFVISHAYTRNVIMPCILCLYDYVMDRVLSDKTHTISSLGSVIDYINGNYNVAVPQAVPDVLDWFCLMRELRQYMLPLTGRGRSALAGTDVSKAKIINLHTLEKEVLVIPFSEKCNCLHVHHTGREKDNA